MPRWITVTVTIFVLSVLCGLVTAAPASARHRALWAWYRQSGARCVHHYEGSWTDPYPAYWGGFQMSLWFQQRFAPVALRRYGTADQWAPWLQVRVTRKVVAGIDRHGRKRFPAYGWGQWSTAPLCGL